MDLLLAQATGDVADLGKAIAFGVGVGLGAVGAGIGIGNIFGSMIQAVARQPELRGELTGIQWLGFALTEAVVFYALLGGLHLSGPGFERVIEPTVAALAELGPDAVVPAHCTGWRAQMRLATELPDAFVPGSVGSRYRFAA